MSVPILVCHLPISGHYREDNEKEGAGKSKRGEEMRVRRIYINLPHKVLVTTIDALGHF